MKTLKINCVLAAALSALLCAGCDVAATGEDMKTAETLCATNGGVRLVSGESDALNGKTVCNNGAIFYFAAGKAVGG